MFKDINEKLAGDNGIDHYPRPLILRKAVAVFNDYERTCPLPSHDKACPYYLSDRIIAEELSGNSRIVKTDQGSKEIGSSYLLKRTS